MKEKKLSADELILDLERKEDYNEEELKIIFNTQANAAKKWLKNNGFTPDVSRATIRRDLAQFEKDIEGLTIDSTYPGSLFWSTVYRGVCAYMIVIYETDKQKNNPKYKQEYRIDKLKDTYEMIWGLMKLGVIDAVPLRTILPVKKGVFIKYKKMGNPINALFTNMALDLVHVFNLTKKGASAVVSDFLKLYFSDEEIDPEVIRRNLYRKKYPSSIIHYPVQKSKTEK